MALQKSALEKENNDYLLAQIGFSEVEEIITKRILVPWKLQKRLYKTNEQLSQDVQKYKQADMQLVTFVKQVIVKKENGVSFETIQEEYKSMQNEEGCPFIRGLIPKKLMRRLSIKFNNQLQYKKLKNFFEFLFCPDSSQFDEEDWSNDWKDYINKEHAAQILKKEVMNLRPVFLSWPPPEKKIDSERKIIPKPLEHFLDIIIICCREENAST